ncbi:MAG TPA: phosphopantetheine-binding protein [Conexibacter sp.]|nr:phosphopantetheine-binding protein [Conexibacter sp.]
MSAAADIHSFLVEELLPGRGIDAIDHDDDLLALGVIDSHGIVELVAFIDRRFGVAIADEDLTPENFASIASIARFVESKADAGAGLGG